MTNLMHTCFILQYIRYNPLHVSSITRSSSGCLNCIDAASGMVLSASGRPVHLCTGRPLTESTIPDAASIQFKTPDDENVMLETRRGLQWMYCKIKQVCIKLVIV